MTVFQFGVRVEASEPGSPGASRWAPAGPGERASREPLVLAPLVRGCCTDAVIESGPVPHRALVYFDRDAASFAAAVVTAVVDLERSGLACLAVVPDDDLVTVGVIAPRLGVSPGLAGGLLRDGPSPVLRCGGERVFRWSDVVARLRAVSGGSVAGPSGSRRTFAALNQALRLRELVRVDPALAAAVRDLLAA